MLRTITYFFAILLITIVQVPCASAQDLDAILAGMGGSSKPSEVNFDAMLGAMGDGTKTKAATVDGTLNFLDNFYSAPLPSYTDYNTTSFGSPKSYSHLVPGSAVLPISGRVTSNYGFRPKFGRMHKGIDISLQTGDTVVAAIAGTVTRVSNDPGGYGLWVEVRHDNGLSTRYAHLSRQLVATGARVYAGTPLGLGGSTGNSTGPHLHFETRVSGEAVDPATMFDFNMPGGRSPYRNLAGLDAENPNYSNPFDITASATSSAITVGGIGGDAQKSTYIVRSGDTIKSVARKHGVSELTLCRLNMLSTTDALVPGRMLKLR